MSSNGAPDNVSSDSDGMVKIATDAQTTDGIVDWDGPSDAQNPHNWSNGKQWAHVAIVAVQGLVP